MAFSRAWFQIFLRLTSSFFANRRAYGWAMFILVDVLRATWLCSGEEPEGSWADMRRAGKKTEYIASREERRRSWGVISALQDLQSDLADLSARPRLCPRSLV